MKAEVLNENLKAALEAVIPTVPSRPILPIFGCVYIEADAEMNTLLFRCTNGDMEVSARATSKVRNSGAVAVSARKIGGLAGALTNNTIVSLDTTENGWLQFSAYESVTNMDTLPPDDFPQPRRVGFEPRFTIEAQDLYRSLRRTAALVDENRGNAMDGVTVSVDDNQLCLTAMNFACAGQDRPPHALISEFPPFTLHEQSIRGLLPLLRGVKGVVTVESSPVHVKAIIEGRTYVASLMEKSLGPDAIERIGAQLRRESRSVVKCDRAAALFALKLMSVAYADADDNFQYAAMSATEGNAALRSWDGKHTNTLGVVEVTGPSFTTGFSAKFMQRAVAELDSAEVCLGFESSAHPLVISAEGETWVSGVSPVKPEHIQN